MTDTPLHAPPGLGPVTEGRLREVGIATIADLRAIGAVEAYRRLKFVMPRQVSQNALYDLEAALRGCGGLDLPLDVRNALQAQSQAIDSALRKGAAARCAI
ncbi:TfoX/Sxy family DNA transformation protein [Microvirga pudoricolor]|uniref:TfoX/Sxy family DNA transformation protein n=1 Tax=Microvirga pudoricolor TaxID=2778729 RepID=UPI0019506135|nr:TfoX/Sxy family DNA transformation protein [Microvirga pudoricolor]MBM6594877.1 TfoX/Sxy family DNA transformation protein [Microvirga pudoricolor]